VQGVDEPVHVGAGLAHQLAEEGGPVWHECLTVGSGSMSVHLQADDQLGQSTVDIDFATTPAISG
jgi:hypothetical protein